jgi:MFS family permease
MSRREFYLSLFVTYLVQSYVAVYFLLPLALRRGGLSLSVIGWVVAIFFAATMGGRPAGGFSLERWGVRATLLWSCGGLILFSLPFLGSPGVPALLGLRLGMGFCFGVAMVALTAYQAMSIPEAVRGSAFGWIAVAYVLPQLTVLPLGDFFLASRQELLFYGLAPLAGLLALWGSLKISPEKDPEYSEKRASSWGSWRDVFRSPGIAFLLFSLGGFALVNSMALQFMGSILGLRGLVPSAFLMANAGVSLGIRFLGNRIFDVIPRKAFAVATIVLMGSVMLFVPGITSNFGLVGWGCLYGIGMGFGFPLQLALMPDVFPRELRPKGVALGSFVMDSGWILSALLGGYLGEHLGLVSSLYAVGFVGICAGLGSGVLGKKAFGKAYWRGEA